MSITITVILMYRGSDGKQFVTAVEDTLTPEQKDKWRKVHRCDKHYKGHEDEKNCMGFQEIEIDNDPEPHGMLNIYSKDDYEE